MTHDDEKEDGKKDVNQMRSLTVESLRLIVQSQLILADLQTNQHRLEKALISLENEARRHD